MQFLNGDSKTGVTIMHMDDGLDTGDIIDIVEIDILPGETTGQLFERIAVLGGETIVPVLTRWVNGEIVATPQDDSMATHTTKITKERGRSTGLSRLMKLQISLEDLIQHLDVIHISMENV